MLLTRVRTHPVWSKGNWGFQKEVEVATLKGAGRNRNIERREEETLEWQAPSSIDTITFPFSLLSTAEDPRPGKATGVLGHLRVLDIEKETLVWSVQFHSR